MIEKLTTKEKIIAGTVVGFLVLVGCQIGYMVRNYDAVTTPVGIFYFVEPTDEVIAHEQCHWEKAQKEGWKYWKKYIFQDRDAMCEEELRCGADISHPNCKNYGK